MTILRAQITLKTLDNIAANFTTNTLHFDVDIDAVLPGLDATMDSVVLNIKETYDACVNVFGGIPQNGHEIVFYDLSQPLPRIPFRSYPMDFALAPVSARLPAEVAIVTSFKTDREAGKSDASRRNRIYLGPLAVGALNTSDGRILVARQNEIRDGMVQLANASGSVDDWTWVVYSPKLGEAYPVKSGHIDNAFDTQRRRGVESTLRTVWAEDAS